MRAILTCFRTPRSVLASAFASLAPGGMLQLRDPIMPLRFLEDPPPVCALAEWNRLLHEAACRVGRRWDNAQHYGLWLDELGFKDVVVRREVCPLSPWSKSRRQKYISLWMQYNFVTGLESFSMALFTRVLGWEVERLRPFLEEVKRDIMDTRIHVYSEGYVWFG